MGLRRVLLLAAAIAVSCAVASPAEAARGARPPVVWLKGEGNFTKSHRGVESIDRIVVHVTEGAFWGSVRWLRNPRAHASSHYVVARGGRIVQLVHLSDIAWHAGNWSVNAQSVGIEHEGFTYGPGGFTDAQYRASARLAAWIARRSLLPIDRRHLIGHAEVPAPGGGRGGASHHTDPGPHWNWNRYLRLVRRYVGVQTLSVLPVVPRETARGIVPWRAKTTGDIRRVEFALDGRLVWVDRRPPFAFAGGRGLNTTKLANGRHVLQVHGVAGPGRYDIARRTIVVDNAAFSLTSAGARPWTRALGPVRLRVRCWGAKAARIVFRVDGRRRAVDTRAPYLFAWNARKAKRGKHVLELVATSVDGRVARQRIPLVAGPPPRPKPKPKPTPKPKPVAPAAPKPPMLRIVSQTVADGQEASGLVLWRVEPAGRPRHVEFLVDGVVRGTDVAAPYTLGWNADAEPAGPHRLTARAVGRDGTQVEATVTVTALPPGGGTAAP